MSGFYIPKEKLSAYQEWQFTDFESEEDDNNPPEVRTAKTVHIAHRYTNGEAASAVTLPIEHLEKSEEIVHAEARKPGTLLAKEQLTAYERWELAALNEKKSAKPAQIFEAFEVPLEEEVAIALDESAALAHEFDFEVGQESTENLETDPFTENSPTEEMAEAIEVSAEPAMVLPTAEEVEAMYQEMRKEGYKQGHSEGINLVLTRVAPSFLQITEVAKAMQRSLTQIDQEVAENMLALTIALAEKIACQSLQLEPKRLLPVIEKAILALNAEAGTPTLYLAPADAKIVREHAPENIENHGWKIVEDAEIESGGCRVELDAKSVDAQVKTRIARIVASFGLAQNESEA